MIRVDTPAYPVTTATHPGMSGKNNEDRYSVSAYRLSPKNPAPVLLAILSDGIGGHRAGEVAAQLAVDRITAVISESTLENPSTALQTAVIHASQEIQAAAQEDPNRFGMGATCAVALVIARRLYTVTVGDSRIYLLRSGAIHQISIDHTWIQEALDSGLIAPEEAAGHPNAHVIRRYLGSPNPPEVDHRIRLDPHETSEQSVANQGMLLQPGDRVFLCSDGLSDLVSEPEIYAAFQNQSADAAVQNLIDLANARGGHDNITVLTFQIPRATQPSAGWRKKDAESILPSWRYLAAGCLATLVIALVISALVIGYSYYSDKGTLPVTSATALYQTLTRSPLTTPQTGASATLELLSSPTPTATIALPDILINGDTLTPWPTNTLAPAETATPTPQ
jgi:protein phosphatase